jgi:serine/threonine protein kinase
MITGRVPFTADTPLAVILKHVSAPLPLPSSVKPDIPEVIEQVILKALTKNPDDRFATVTSFLSDWKSALDEKDSPQNRFDSPSTLPAIPQTLQAQRRPAADSTTAANPNKSTRWIAGCLVGACLLLSISGVAYLGINWRNILSPEQNAAPPDAPTNRPSSEESLPVTGNATEEIFATEIGDEISNGEPESGAGMLSRPAARTRGAPRNTWHMSCNASRQ